MDKLLIAALSILSDDFGKRDAMREAILEGRNRSINGRLTGCYRWKSGNHPENKG